MVNISAEELKKAHKENEEWEKKADYWHNAIPNFDNTRRASLTKDVQTITNIKN